MAISRRQPPPSLVIRHAERPWTQAHRPLSWPICPLNTSSSSLAEPTPGKPPSPACQWSFRVLARAIPRQTGASIIVVHTCACIAAFTVCKLIAPPWKASFSRAYSNMTMSTCLIFPPKNCSRSSSAWYDATRCASCEQRRLHYSSKHNISFAHLARCGLHADRIAGGRRGRLTGTIRIYLYSSWLKYHNDGSVAELTSL